MNIKELIGETTECDKKVALEEKRPKSWLKSVSAFSNGIGGAIIFGVSDDEQPIGLENAKLIAEKISEIVKMRLDPIPQVVLEIHQEDGKDFVILRIPAGDETPYYYVGDGTRTAFIRVGNESIPAVAADLRRLVLRGTGKTYDSLLSPYQYKDFSFTRLRSVYRLRAGQDMEESDFVSFGLMDETGTLTNAGALLADDSPVRHSRLFCTRWYGLDKASGVMEALDDKEYSGSLVSLLQYGEDFIKNNTKKRWKKTPDGRVEMPDIPERAALECLVNGLIHRDYLETGSEVHIDIYDDRMEIYSPGGMYAGTFVQNLDTDRVPSKRRNPIIADVFSRMNYMERRGSGFRKIKSDYRAAVNYLPELEPKFYSDSSSFWVTLYNLNYHVPVEQSGKATFDEGKATFDEGKATFETQKAIFQASISDLHVKQPTKEKMMKVYEKVGYSQPFGRAEIMNIISVSSYSAGELIKKMREAGLIEPVDGRGKGKYQFIIKPE
ncbi:MAG: putative DNA binding domain-containing protein [Lachnospiraceae bacterium]|nr:putative DNA binding domain-containing protein [Lachnospiraceae bacterium]